VTVEAEGGDVVLTVGGQFDLPEGTIYPALHKLERDGLGEERVVDRGRPEAARLRADQKWSDGAVGEEEGVDDVSPRCRGGVGVTDDEVIERYLDALLVGLRGSPRTVRRVLAEAESHLRDAVAAGADGEEAVRRFGEPRVVAAASNRFSGTPMPVVLRQLLLAACLLSAIGCIAIGASGAISGAMDAAFGPKFVAGDLPSITYTSERCAEYRVLAPHEESCRSAAARHHTNEVETFRVAVGLMGILALGVWAFLRRRWLAGPATGALPAALVPGVGTSVFGVAALVLASQAMQSIGWHTTAGLGQWLSAAVVSAAVAGAFGLTLLRTLRLPARVHAD
jgi:hypothetical protein